MVKIIVYLLRMQPENVIATSALGKIHQKSVQKFSLKWMNLKCCEWGVARRLMCLLTAGATDTSPTSAIAAVPHLSFCVAWCCFSSSASWDGPTSQQLPDHRSKGIFCRDSSEKVPGKNFHWPAVTGTMESNVWFCLDYKHGWATWCPRSRRKPSLHGTVNFARSSRDNHQELDGWHIR